jgi:DNA-binding Lrp family transcriptional regulator
MDEQDEKLIKELKRNARASISVLSKKLGLPRTTIHYRLRKLIKEGIIKGFTVKLDYSKLGKGTTAFILATYDPSSGVSQRDVARSISLLEDVAEVHIISGEWDLLIKVRSSSVEEIGKIVVDKLREIKGVKSTMTCVSFVTVKEE